MCGICGVYGPAADRAVIDRMCQAMVHRGPDSAGFYSARNIALGMRRLRVIDLATGEQPIFNENGTIAIVFNGEIYNYVDLRRDLEALGHRFSTSSDTECIVHAYEEWGFDCPSHLRGMFAFAIWDAGHQRLFLARDRLGIKPLYYHRGPGIFLFASEVRALLASSVVPRKLSPPGLLSYLALGAVQDPLTIIDSIFSLPPGHYAIWDGQTLAIHQYWSVANAFRPSRPLPRQEIIGQLRELLEESVRLHLVSDVPLGVFLSGGIDSSAMVSLACRVSNRAPHTVSVVFPEEEFSEASFMRRVSKEFSTEHNEIVLSGTDMLRELPAALSAMDQPTFDGVNTYIVAKQARKAGLTVALSGVGGDEMFGGYSTFKNVARLNALRRYLPPLASHASAALARRVLRDTDQARKLARWLDGHDLDGEAYLLTRELFGPDDRRLLSPTMADHNSARKSELTPLPRLDVSNLVSARELSHYMPNVLLHDTDVMSMAHSLEVRVPFLDHRLVEFVASLSGEVKSDGRRPKPLLVEAIGDSLPTEIAQRPKIGFTLPLASWLGGPLRSTVEETLLDSHFGGQAGDALDPAATGAVWQRFCDGKGTWVRPWALYVLKVWSERHLGSRA